MTFSSCPPDGPRGAILPKANAGSRRDLLGRKTRRLLLLWAEADQNWNKGHYRRAVQQRISALVEAHHIWSAEFAEAPSNIYSADYSSNVGHIGILAMHVRAKSAGYLSSSKICVLSNRVGNLGALRSLRAGGGIDLLAKKHQAPESSNFSVLFSEASEPSTWPMLQRLSTPQTSMGYLDTYQFHEQVALGLSPRDWAHSPFLVSDRTRATLQAIIRSRGKFESYVALHIRKIRANNDHRSSEPSRYLLAVESLLSRGLGVIQIGHQSASLGLETPGFIDLTFDPRVQNDLFTAVIQGSRFVISNQSGPGTLALSAGRPVLTCDSTSIGRNHLSGPPGTRYLPKITEYRQGMWDMRRVLDSPIGYWEGVTTTATEGLYLRNSSSEIIRDACQEMLDDPLGERNRVINIEAGWRKLLDETEAVGKGLLATSFIERFPELLEA